MTFNINRFFDQLKWDALQNYRFLYVSYLVVFGLMLFFPSNFGSHDVHSGFFGFTLFLGGLIYTSTIFDEMNTPQSKQFYLTTPSSHLEKFVSKLALSTVIFAIVTLIVFTIISFLAVLVAEIRVGSNFPSFNPFRAENFEVIKSYFIIQSIFLLGAVAFRRISFLKTVAAMIGLGFLLSTILAAFGAGAFSEYLNFDGNFSFNINFSALNKLPDNLEESGRIYLNILFWLFWLVLAPVMWVITYFKITEKEV